MATINGAKALKLDKEIGSIEVGKSADIIMIQLKDILTQPINNIFAQLVYNAKGTNVDMTMINGKILMQKRIVYGVKESEITHRCHEIIKRIEKE